MKIKFLPLIAVFFAATSIMTSCLDNDVDQITYTSETSITGFSLGTLHIDRVGKDKDGKDSAYVDTLNCSDYPFTINQLTREIENKDSLPYGTHIDKVITSITYDAGALAYRPKGADTDTLWTSTDSIDFSGDTYSMSTITPIEFKVYAYSGAIGQAYKVKINVHQQVPDTIAWKKFDTNPFSAGSLSEQKAVYANGKVYVFGKNGNGTHIEYSDVANDNPSSWVPVTDNIPTNRPIPGNPLYDPSRRIIRLVYQFGETRNRTAGCSETGTQLVSNQPLPTRRKTSAPILQWRQRCASQYSRFTCNKAWDCKAEFTCTP